MLGSAYTVEGGTYEHLTAPWLSNFRTAHGPYACAAGVPAGDKGLINIGSIRGQILAYLAALRAGVGR